MKQSLQLKMGQHLTMTPQLQQAIRLLQLSTLDLQQEIQEIVDTNPMLEVSEENEASSDANTGDTDSASDIQASINEIKHDTDSGIEAVSDDYIAANAAETSTNQDDTSRNDNADWQDNIPNELPVDSSWDDVYTTAPTSSGSQSLDFNEMADLDNRNSSSESLSSHLLWQLNLTPMSDTDQLIATAIIDALAPSGMLSISPEELLETFDET
ncbi:MAG: RNA polymerase factor sigma-54, partial [Pseudomonadales bacterium]|nr:RNA polymerase factor sigma-54 [Pseudomonadales bacterium]